MPISITPQPMHRIPLVPRVRVAQPSAVRFSSDSGIFRDWMNGYSVNAERLEREKHTWNPVISSLISQYNAMNLATQFPGVARSFEVVGMPAKTGIPPAVRVNPETMEKPAGRIRGFLSSLKKAFSFLKPWQEPARTANTNGGLATVLLHLMKSLPRTESCEGTLAQLLTGVKTINAVALQNYQTIQGDPQWVYSGGLSEDGPLILPLAGRAYSSIQYRHGVVIAPNGALQVFQIPSAKDTIAMIEADPVAAAWIEGNRPLSHYPPDEDRSCAPFKPLKHHEATLAQTRAHLSGLAAGTVPPRSTPWGWDDIHTLMYWVPFDYAKHIAEGRIKVILDKPGLNGQNVWEALSSLPRLSELA